MFIKSKPSPTDLKCTGLTEKEQVNHFLKKGN